MKDNGTTGELNGNHPDKMVAFILQKIVAMQADLSALMAAVSVVAYRLESLESEEQDG